MSDAYEYTNTIFFLLILLLSLPGTLAEQYLAVDWSKQIHGPDGPWDAVSVQIGGEKSETSITLQQVNVDLYPGST
jgi:hypothetical protein